MARRKAVKEASVEGSLTLDDLRWLVEECEGYAGGSTVAVRQGRNMGPLDGAPDRIAVHGKEATSE